MGGPGASTSLGFDPDADTGRIDVFVRGLDDALWYRTLSADGIWTPWQSLGGVLTADPSAMAFGYPDDGEEGPDFELQVFGRGTDGALWSRRFVGGPDGGWEPWGSLGGILKGGPGAGGRAFPLVAVRGQDDAAWYRDYFVESGEFGPWTSAGGILTDDPDADNSCEGPDIWARGTDNAIDEKFLDLDWESFGGLSRSGPGVHELLALPGRDLTSPDSVVSVRGLDDGLWALRLTGCSFTAARRR